MKQLSDVTVWPGISIAYATKYNKKYHAQDCGLETTIDVIRHARNMLISKGLITVDPKNLPHIRIAGIKGGGTKGRFTSHLNLITLELHGRTLSSIIKTLCHEMVHAEQHFQGRLQVDMATRCWVWNQTKFYSFASAKRFDIYVNLPWEKEAFARQETLAAELSLT